MSLNHFLTRLIWFSVLPLIALAGYLAWDIIRDNHAARDLEAANLARNAATAIDRMLDARERALGMLAATAAADHPVRREELYLQALAFRQSFDAHVILADSGLKMLFNTRRPYGAALPPLPRPRGRAAAPETLETGEPAVGDVFPGPLAGEPLVAVTMPIRQQGKTAYVLIAAIETRQFQQRLDEIALPAGWMLTLFDNTGTAIARLAPPEVKSTPDSDAAHRFVASLKHASWSVVLEIPRDIHRGALLDTVLALGLLIAGATLTAVVMARFGARQLKTAVSALIETPAPDARTTPITEITTIRGLLDDAVEQRLKAEKHNRETQALYIAQLEKVFMGAVEVATNLGELRDPFNAGHQRRAANLAAAIGAELGFDAQRQEGMRVAGFLYDIGKISVPAEILSRPARLNAAEFDLVKQHCQASYDVLHKVEFPWPVAEAALQHHERMDGSGYPQGLKDGAILLEARILGVADVVEAMCSHRPYRPARGIDKALEEIEGGSGTRYDAAVVGACVRLFREKGYQLPG